MDDRKKAYAAATVYAIIMALSFMFVKLTLTIASPLDTLAHRFTIAWIAAAVLWKFKKEPIHISKKDLGRIALLALFYPTLFFSLQVFGLVYTSSSMAGIIQATVPVHTLIFAGIFLKETATLIQKIAISLSVLGVIYIIVMSGTETESISLLGISLLLLSALSSSLYQVTARKLTQHYSLFTLTYVITLFGFIVFNGMALTDHVIKGTVEQFFEPFRHLHFVAAVLYLGLLSSLGTSYLSNYALAKLPAFQMSVFGNLSTVLAILAGIFFLHEPFFFYHGIGAALIILGVVSVNYFKEKTITRRKSA